MRFDHLVCLVKIKLNEDIIHQRYGLVLTKLIADGLIAHDDQNGTGFGGYKLTPLGESILDQVTEYLETVRV